MNDREKNALATRALVRINALMDQAGTIENGQSLPPAIQAEIELIFAEGRALGVISGERPFLRDEPASSDSPAPDSPEEP